MRFSLGFPLSLTYYYRRIQAVLRKISDLSEKVLPSNRATIDKFLGSPGFLVIELVLAVAYEAEEHIEWDDEVFDKFKSYVIEQEDHMKESLQTIKYNIDAPSTVTLLFGSGRIEKVRSAASFRVLLLICH